MRGAVVVGDPMSGLVDISPVAFAAFLALRGTGDDIPSDTSGPDR